MDLTRDAMLVGLRITAWSGRRHDRHASNHVAAAHDAAVSAGRYNKLLLPKDAFARIATTVSAARTTHYANTLPWDDQGSRLLTVANYETYVDLMDALSERLIRERTDFVENYDHNIDRARLDLGKLFRIEDYPAKEALAAKFTLRYRIVPVPNADHFMAKLACADTERVRRDIESDVEERLHDAAAELWRRFSDCIQRVSERLREDENGKPLQFRDTMIENLRDLVDVAPRLNIFGDRRLAALCEQVKHRIASVDPAALRPSQRFDPELRERVRDDADALLQQFAGYFGAADQGKDAA